MAAVAAGAAAVPTTTKPAGADGDGPLDPDPAGTELTGGQKESSGVREPGPLEELSDPGAQEQEEEERRHGRPQPAAGTEDPGDPAHHGPGDPAHHGPGDPVHHGPGDPAHHGPGRFSPGSLGEAEGGGNVSCSLRADPQLSAVFLHSFPAPPPVTEAGLSLQEPAEPTTNGTSNRAEAAGRDKGYSTPVHPALRSGPEEEPDPRPGSGSEERLQDSAPPCRSPWSSQTETRPEPGSPGLGLVGDLSPGSEVRVNLDHVIDDALVVSFRLGEKVFSGVLMDVSRRFGPYGIPITVFPRRDDRIGRQLSAPSLPVANDDHSMKQEEVSPVATPPSHPWTSKPPPLFQEGAPYPPPLFIRDTYNQALPQPLPRKIKRPKRRYRCEEPTSIMNAIKLRPRQVLCDKCKGVVTSGGHREARRGTIDLRGEEASRRRRQTEAPLSSEVKRLRSDDKGGRPALDRRPSSGIRLAAAPSSTSSSSSSSRRVLKGVASSGRLCLNSKKVLDKRDACAKARPLLNKLAAAHRQPKDQNQNRDSSKAVTRAAAMQNHNQKVHFTRRLQHAPVSSPLPPRMRLKPQSKTLKSC